ncbi:hypothetical protein J2Y41_003470 [Arthrobacter sp. 1088]|uniref:hypothetical protein n=1 Tax=Arthrobacter sp. 1088 TaxID=2817768 RepID=UPI00285B5396|nr:hypothetical protein [Arthrobacter sp. 1088]MDR6687894.1 hypothetical protein [Arthrobacter sp. 1088]
MVDVVTYQTRAELAELVSRQRHRQVYSLRLMAASAIAAAGQVRDTRLDRLENPSPPPQPDFWFDLLFEIALAPAFSLGAGLIMRKIAKPILTARLGPSRHLMPRPSVPGTPWVPKLVPAESADRASNEVESLLRVRAANAADDVAKSQRLEELWAGLASGTADSLADIGKKHWDESREQPAEKLPFKWPIPPEKDSPASMVEEAVLRGVARHEAAIGVVFDAFLFTIHDPALTSGQVELLRIFLNVLAELPSVDESAAKDLRLFYETCIWCLMYPRIATTSPPKLPKNQFLDVSKIVKPESRVQLLIDIELATYLVRRLPRPGGRESFAAYASRATRRKPRQPAESLNSIGSRWHELGGGLSDSLAAFNEVSEEDRAARTTHTGLLDKNGEPIEEQNLFISSFAYAALAEHFRRLSHDMRSVLARLQTQPALVYGQQKSGG